MHAHIGFLARGRIQGEYRDGCTFDFSAPQVVRIDPGHDAWVVGDEAAVLIQFDSEEGTARRFGLPSQHKH
jgi:streptogramin lyase